VLRGGSPQEARRAELDERRAAFAQAYDWFRHNDFEQAAAVFTDLVRSYPQLADHHLYFTGISRLRLGDDDDAEKAFDRLGRQYPRSVHAPAAEVELGTLLVRTKHVDLGRSWLQRAQASDDKRTALRARLALAEADEGSNDVSDAYAAFMAVRTDAPGSVVG